MERSTNNQKTSDKFKALSLFSGAGGLDIGIERTSKFSLLACVEKERDFCKTLEINRDAGIFGNRDTSIINEDISSLSPLDLMRRLNIKPGELDLLIGGPPCQTYSTAGKRASLADPRGQLIFDFLRFVEVMKPRFFLMENVRGLLSSRIKHVPIKDRNKSLPTKREEPGSVLKLWLDELKRVDDGNYRVDVFEVNAVNYGAPQLRERVLFIGNRENKLTKFPEPTHGPEKDRPFRTIREALANFEDDNPEILDFSERKKHYLSMIPEGGNWRSLPSNIAEESMGKAYYAKGGRSGWWRRLSWDLPSPTITTLPNHASTSMCHPEEIRALSIAECARIQEFPDEWKFSGSTQNKMKQIGNAVPPRLGQLAGEVIASYLSTSVSEDDQLNNPFFTRTYLSSHVRTRKWWDGSQAVSGSSAPTSVTKQPKLF